MRRIHTLALVFLLVGAVAATLIAAVLTGTSPAIGQTSPADRFLEACVEQSDDPWFVTTNFPRGGSNDADPSIVAFHDTGNNRDHVPLATAGELGALYGLGFHSGSETLYAASFHKRGTHFGPDGPGAVYALDLRSGDAETFVVVPNAGPDVHDPRDDYFPDLPSRFQAGRTSLGDLDLSDDGRELAVVNLFDRLIYRYSVPDGVLLGTFEHGASHHYWAEDARPFGLGYRDDRLYHGVVRTAESTQRYAELTAFVYESAWDGSDMREVSQAPLRYDRGFIYTGEGQAAWNPWVDPPGHADERYGRYPMPMLSDLVFTESGAQMVLGFRDRYGETTFYTTRQNPPPPGERIHNVPAGDILPAFPDAGLWRIQTEPEHYFMDHGPPVNRGRHDETSFGGLAVIPWLDRVVMSANSPQRVNSAGIVWFDTESGDDTAREEIYYFNGAENFGKANGLGDVELLCGDLATPTPTPSATPTVTATPTRVTATSTRTATPIPEPIYIPAGEKSEKCIPDAFHSDVVLVLDRSTSMLRAVEDGGIPKNQAAIDAAKLFVSMLDFTPDTLNRHDQVAVVGFNDTAWVQSDLGFSYEVAYGALDQLATMTQEGTRLDLAFLRGQEPLDGPHRKPENRPVIVLLTDGLPNRVPTPAPIGPQEQTVVEAAQLAKNKGTRIYTVGLGKPTDINPRMLILAASERWMYYYAPRPEDLSGIYSQIAQTFDDCEPVDIDRPTPCIPEEIFTDVVLVLDMSTSMFRETRTGRSKHGAAVEAAGLFADQLQLEPDGWGRQDQVAVVGFNDTAWTEVPLTADIQRVHRGLGDLLQGIEQGTRLDLAFDEGQRAVSGPGHYPENQMIMVFLTDGLPNRVPTPVPEGPQEQTVLEAATRAKDAGTRVFTIGLGLPDDVLRQLLEMAATMPEDYFFAPDGEDLADIYRQIAGRIVECP